MIRDVVDDAQAVEWKNELKEFVKVNDVEGIFTQFERTRIYKSHLIILNQVFPLTTSNFSISCALKNTVFLNGQTHLTGLISWTKPQVQARSHPNMLTVTAWLSKLYHIQVANTGNNEKNDPLANTLEGVDLNIPLTYADRFRIRKPGTKWVFDFNPPHVDGACLTFSFNLFFIQDTRRRNNREMGRPILQKMFRENIKWQLERS